MPIKGLTDRPAGFAEIGQIRKGGPKEANKPGKDLDYFRVEFDEEERDAQEAFVSFYGAEPKEIDILLPFATVDENFDAWREAYLAGGLVHRCDGERVWYEVDWSTGEKLVTNGDPETYHDPTEPILTYGKDEKELFCRPYGRLKVILPVLNRFAFLTALTGSFYDVANIASQLRAYETAGPKGLIGIPLKLRRRPMQVSMPGTDGKKVRVTKSMLSIEADPRWVTQKITEMKMQTLTQMEGGELALLTPPPRVEDEVDDLNGYEDPPAPNDTVTINGDPASGYWDLVYKRAKLDKQAGMEILKAAGGDFEKAAQVVIEQHLPPA